MNLLIDKLILFIGCFAVYLTGKPFTDDVAPVLIAVIFSCLLSYYDHERVQVFLTASFALLGLVMPWICVFLPLICYDTFFSKRQWVCLSGAVPFALFWPQARTEIDVIVCILIVLSASLKFRASAFARLKDRYIELRDTTREMALRLKQQNQELLVNQDNEVKMATLGERNRIAREIHDNVGHLLSSALLQIGALLVVIHDRKTKDALASLKETLSEAMNSIRTSVHNLHDDSIDLHAQLTDLVHKFTFCPLVFDYSLRRAPNSKLSSALISIVKEAMSNIVRHSDATRARIILREHPAFYQLIIADNGHVRHLDFDRGIGLKNIKDRVEAFHGLMNIETGAGFKIFVSIPKGEKDHECTDRG